MPTMKQDLSNFVQDLIVLLQERYQATGSETQSATDPAAKTFLEGVHVGYQEALEVIQHQLEAFGYDPETVGLGVRKSSEILDKHAK